MPHNIVDKECINWVIVAEDSELYFLTTNALHHFLVQQNNLHGTPFIQQYIVQFDVLLKSLFTKAPVYFWVVHSDSSVCVVFVKLFSIGVVGVVEHVLWYVRVGSQLLGVFLNLKTFCAFFIRVGAVTVPTVLLTLTLHQITIIYFIERN